VRMLPWRLSPFLSSRPHSASRDSSLSYVEFADVISHHLGLLSVVSERLAVDAPTFTSPPTSPSSSLDKISTTATAAASATTHSAATSAELASSDAQQRRSWQGACAVRTAPDLP
jgi:hypothetical protein